MKKKISKNTSKKTALIVQYENIKAKYPGAILLFRVGDFYETFGEDAIKTSRILDIVLTKRANGKATKIELAGFPHHSLDNYMPKLVRAGYRVAICEQLENPKETKGIVKRGVTELVTPGLTLNESVLESKLNNYLGTVYHLNNIWGIAFLDLSTGEFLCAQGSKEYIKNLLISFNPSEIIYRKDENDDLKSWIQEQYNYNTLDSWVFQYDFAFDLLTQHFNTANLKGFGIADMHQGIVASGAILQYLKDTKHHELAHILSISRIDQSNYVWLDRFTIRNLELISPQQEGGTPLIDILDKTASPMGARLLKKWVIMPLRNIKKIQKRQEIVKIFSNEDDLIQELNTLLKSCGDLERLTSKLVTGRINPRELQQLKKSLEQINPIKTLLTTLKKEQINIIVDRLHTCELLVQKIDNQLIEEAGIHSNQGNIIKQGVDNHLDELKKIAYAGKEYLLEMQKREVENTGINSLKIAFNKIFGYYLEVTHAHKHKVPKSWIRKQTLVNAERYITPELKEYEEKIVNAEEQLFALEQTIFNQLVQNATSYVQQMQQNAQILAQIDCMMSFAFVAIANDYCMPTLTNETTLNIKAGRHPVIEQCLLLGEDFIPNDIFLDDEKQQIIIITGPNMAGKSALLRQTALIVLMAQMGAFVPAKSAFISCVDKVFTRVGATDNLSRGESTFMVEMSETASILNNLSNHSLIIMDEIGRGTSTYDGISIAWSIVEYLHNHLKFRPKTLFATHYHELNQLTKEFIRIKNFNVAVKEVGNKVIFLRKLVKGGSEHSFGIHVAQMAGMPNSVIIRANEIMQHLEENNLTSKNREKLSNIPINQYQLDLFEEDPHLKSVKKIIDDLNIDSLTPVQALMKLNEIKQKMS